MYNAVRFEHSIRLQSKLVRVRSESLKKKSQNHISRIIDCRKWSEYCQKRLDSDEYSLPSPSRYGSLPLSPSHPAPSISISVCVCVCIRIPPIPIHISHLLPLPLFFVLTVYVRIRWSQSRPKFDWILSKRWWKLCLYPIGQNSSTFPSPTDYSPSAVLKSRPEFSTRSVGPKGHMLTFPNKFI